ncbi:MAG: carboxypeptidase M32 [Atopobiaceae bacterium]|nr:carboxypeptidase M32 [Atopobiaceae bacterium]
MTYENSTTQALEQLDTFEQLRFALNYAITTIVTNGEISDPPLATEPRGEALATLETELHKLMCAPEIASVLDTLTEAAEQGLLDERRQAQLRIVKRDRAEFLDLPADEAADFARLTNEATQVWMRAKRNNDWASFEPFLERIVESMKRLAAYKNASADPYDVWLNEYEYGSTRPMYDQLFSDIKDCVVPLVADIQKKGWQPSRACLEGHYAHDAQMAFAHDLLVLEGLNMDALVVAESEHPFSEGLVSQCGYVTTHVNENDVVSSLYSVLHEGGHASYSQGVNPELDYCSLGGGSSMGIHESQSRFFENYVGRNEAFVPHLLALLEKHFPGHFAQVDPHDFFLAVNRAEPSLIRTEADELTYPLHVLIRYEIEQLVFSGEAQVSDIPRLWSERYKSYLGVDVPDVSSGPLQDMHWSDGMFGYFPTYVLGSAYGTQFLDAMKSDGVDFDGLVARGDLAPIRAWLGEKIWQHGRSKDPAQLVLDATGSAFDSSHYTRYLEQKFSSIYNL